MAVTIVETEVELTLAARDRAHSETLFASLREHGYSVELLR